jgi:hypothetical protein
VPDKTIILSEGEVSAPKRMVRIMRAMHNDHTIRQKLDPTLVSEISNVGPSDLSRISRKLE